MTYTEDRATFERDLRRPPHLARMLEHAGRYVGRLTKVDKDSLLEMAMDHLWNQRDQIHVQNDILRVWIESLSRAANSRKRWLIWYNMGGWRWERSSQLGKD